MTTKEIKKDTYVNAHVGVIIYHSVLAVMLFVSQYVYGAFGTASKNIVIFVAFVLLLTSLLSLIPILKKHDKIIIE